ncbi:MAG: AMP-binding enzyme [Candidatus Hodarchaeales archaeon]|jgi:acyl-CoA synthetase (AMP-forming)/AMP-acid ligase II
MDEDGYFNIVDRIKDMINVSGMKVYSRVVDDALFGHPAVSEAGIIGVPDPERPGSERIKAFIALKGGHTAKREPPPLCCPKIRGISRELAINSRNESGQKETSRRRKIERKRTAFIPALKQQGFLPTKCKALGVAQERLREFVTHVSAALSLPNCL